MGSKDKNADPPLADELLSKPLELLVSSSEELVLNGTLAPEPLDLLGQLLVEVVLRLLLAPQNTLACLEKRAIGSEPFELGG